MTDPFNRHTEARTFGGNADIAARRDFEPTTGARPLDHGDGRVLAVEQDLKRFVGDEAEYIGLLGIGTYGGEF